MKIFKNNMMGSEQKRLRTDLRSGFTLIELLVVVLIIGILSAVALPQYQKVVDKSRYMQLLAVMKPLKQAETVYYLATGAYTDDFSQLDIDMPPGGVLHNGMLKYKDFDISIGLNPHYYVSGNSKLYAASLLIYLKSEQMECRAFSSERADALCKSLGGIYSYTDKGMRVYVL